MVAFQNRFDSGIDLPLPWSFIRIELAFYVYYGSLNFQVIFLNICSLLNFNKNQNITHKLVQESYLVQFIIVK